MGVPFHLGVRSESRSHTGALAPREAKGGWESGLAWAGVAQREWPTEERLDQAALNRESRWVYRRGRLNEQACDLLTLVIV